METIAFYRETIIKTYGFFEKTGLSLITVEFPVIQTGMYVARALDSVSTSGSSVLLLTVRPLAAGTMRLNLLWDEEEKERGEADPIYHLLEQEFKGLRWRKEKEVELIFFQGPHYGDRYGIASAALGAAADSDVPLLVAACIGATVFWVLPKGQGAPARESLSRAFVVPESKDRN
ncbi:MAG: hypothetical protein AB1585_17765 [Thermodesulfobacteriota bacterium]